MRGGEKVLEAICELYPDATLYTLVRVPGSVSARARAPPDRTSLGPVAAPRRPAVPALPAAFSRGGRAVRPRRLRPRHQQQPLRGQVGRAAGARHARLLLPLADALCLGPVRRLLRAGPGRERLAAGSSGRSWRGLARWDAATAGRVDRFLANSQYVAGRIRRYYNRGSTVVYPPVDTDFYRPAGPAQPPSGLPRRLGAGALQAPGCRDRGCRRIGAPADDRRARPRRGPPCGRMAGPDVEFLGWRADDEIRDLYQRAAAVLLPGVEDFGMVPVEAQACGTPGRRASRRAAPARRVVDGVTGVLVHGCARRTAFAAGLDARARPRALDSARHPRERRTVLASSVS